MVSTTGLTPRRVTADVLELLRAVPLVVAAALLAVEQVTDLLAVGIPVGLSHTSQGVNLWLAFASLTLAAWLLGVSSVLAAGWWGAGLLAAL